MNEAVVRVALIGCGRIAQVAHLPALEKAEGVQPVAVSDPGEYVARPVARRYDVPKGVRRSVSSPRRRID